MAKYKKDESRGLLKLEDLRILFRSYVCPFFRQNGEDGLLQEEEKLIPQQFNIYVWIG